MIKSEIKFVNERNNKPTAISAFWKGTGILRWCIPRPPCDNGKEKAKSLENSVFSRLFVVRVKGLEPSPRNPD